MTSPREPRPAPRSPLPFDVSDVQTSGASAAWAEALGTRAGQFDPDVTCAVVLIAHELDGDDRR